MGGQEVLESATLLHDGKHSLIYVANVAAFGGRVVLKLQKEQGNKEIAHQFENEFIALRQFSSPKIRPALGKIHVNHQTALVLKYIDGLHLKAYLDLYQPSLSEKLIIAISLCQLLHEVHQQGLLHGNFCSDNILIQPSILSATLIDFKLATTAPKFVGETHLCSGLALPYLAPELSGKACGAADERADLYSLGIVLYEFFGEALPFKAKTPQELIHAHLAVAPAWLQEVQPSIPGSLAELVHMLLAKSPELRYQSAIGVQTDLEQCMALLEQRGEITPFPLARFDKGTQLCFPATIFGREKELKQVQKVWHRVLEGAAEQLWISGPAGIGKTTLAEQAQHWASQKGAYIGKGKFDLLSTTKPYDGLVQALSGLIDVWLTKDDSELIYWRDRIQEALGSEGRLLTDLVPRLKLLIGNQPPVSTLDGPEAQHRFHYVLRNFIKALAPEDNPLLLQLDDLQWADSATLDFLQEMFYDQGFASFLFIGIYREQEAQANPHFITLQQSSGATAWRRLELALNNLSQEEVSIFVQEIVEEKTPASLQLAEVLYAKTKGNPLALTQFLRSIFQDGLLRKESSKKSHAFTGGGWTWQLDKIAQLPQTDNVLNLIISRFKQLDADTQLLLQTAALIGNNFDRNTLLELIGEGIQHPLTALSKAIQEGYFAKVAGPEDYQQIPTYRFLHDRLLQGVRLTVSEQAKHKIHLRLGKILKLRLGAQENQESLFDVVAHLKQVQALLEKEERAELAELSLQAGKKAMASAGYTVALGYLEDGVKLLGPASWQNSYLFTLELYTDAANAAYLTGAFEKMDGFIEQVLAHARQELDKARVIETRIKAQIAGNQGAAAVETALNSLLKLGVSLPRNPSKAATVASLLKTELMLRHKGLHKLANMPDMKDPKALAIMQIMASVGSAVSRSAPALFPMFVCKLVQLSLKKGNAPASIPAYSGYGVLQTALFNKVQTGSSYGQLAIDLLQKFKADAAAAKTYIIIAAFLDFWVSHLRNSVGIAKKVYELGIKNGDHEFAASGLMLQCIHGYFSGEPLYQLSEKTEDYCQGIRQLKQELLYQQTRLFHQSILNLLQEGELSQKLKGNVFDEEKVLTEAFMENSKAGVYYYHLNKLILGYMAGQFVLAREHSSYLANKEEHVMATAVLPVYVFYDALLQAALYPGLPRDQQKEAMERLDKARARMMKWARHAPMNYKHKAELLQAELWRIKGDKQQARCLYESAAQGAHEQGYLQDKALIAELTALHLLAEGNRESAQLYLVKAYNAYLQWGARAKAALLVQTHPEILHAGISGPEGTATSVSARSLNVESLLEAATALSSQIKLDKMLEVLLTTVLQQAGAEEAYILLNRNENLEVMAKGRAGQAGVELLLGFPIEEYQEVPLSVINLSYRTQEELILSDVQADRRFATDATVAIRHIRSVLSFPVIRQQRVLGIIYLHNTLSTGSFTDVQLQVLRLLSGQIAVALENAQLYTEMEQRVEERTRELKIQQQILENKNKELELLNEEKDELVNIVAHDLRSPLNQIRGLLNLIKLSPATLTPDQYQFVDLGLKSSERLSAMIGRILNTNAMESQKISLNLEMVDLDILLEEVITNFRIQASEKDIALHLILPEHAIEIELDRNYTIQVLDNLLSNALKFSPSGSQVEVMLYEDGDLARIEVKDNGPGISKKDQKRLFSRFQTLSARPTAGEASSGLGLSIAKRYVEAMGGRIGCDSEMGEGSVFFVEFVLV